MDIQRYEGTFGRQCRNRLEGMDDQSIAGARAAVETFYYAFNTGSLDVFKQVWLPNALVRLNNPLGGIVEGIDGIAELYGRIFTGPARVWVEFHDIVEYHLGDVSVVFAGRERGEFTIGETTVPLDIRTTRVFTYLDGRWGQAHHHGSITDTKSLDNYRRAVLEA